MKNVEPGIARASNAERSIEGVTACLREIDGAQDLLDRRHIDTPSSISAVLLSRDAVLRRRLRDPESPGRSITRRERIGENPIDVAVICASVRRRLARRVRHVSFMRLKGRFTASFVSDAPVHLVVMVLQVNAS